MDTETAGLSADDVWAMRNADSASFHTVDDESFIRVYLRKRYGRIYTAREQRTFNVERSGLDEYMREIPVHDHRLEDYSGRNGAWRGYASCDDTTIWRTIAGSLRKGDRLGFHWVASNNGELMQSVGFHRDELRMHAMSPDRKNGRTFQLATEVGPLNVARMIRRTP